MGFNLFFRISECRRKSYFHNLWIFCFSHCSRYLCCIQMYLTNCKSSAMSFTHVVSSSLLPFIVLSERKTLFLPIQTPLSIGQDMWVQLHFIINTFICDRFNDRNKYVFFILICVRALAGWPVASLCHPTDPGKLNWIHKKTMRRHIDCISHILLIWLL